MQYLVWLTHRRKRSEAVIVARLVDEVEAALAATPIDLDNVIKFKRSLEEKVTTLKDLDKKLLDCIDDERVITDEIQQSDEFLSKEYAALHKADEALSTRTTGASAIRVNPVRLPKLTIHPFSGDITQWTSSSSLLCTPTDS